MKSTMKGILFPGSKKVVVREFPRPRPGPGEVLIEMRASGLCGSDLEYLFNIPEEDRGKPYLGMIAPPDIIPGHEPSGVVIELGPGVRHLKVGDRVAVYHISGCGTCKYCRSGWQILCRNKTTYGFDRHGGDADYMVADEKDCVILPDNLSFAVGAYCACGAGTAFQVTRRLGISGLDDVVIFGVGPVGLAATLFASFQGARVIAVDVNDERLDLAREIGAKHVINPLKTDVITEIKRLTHGEGASVTIDCSGNPDARVNALECAKTWGRTAFVGEGHKTTIDPSPQLIHKELTLIGSWVYSIPTMMELFEYLDRFKLPLEKLITNRYSIEDAPRALADFSSGKTAGKAVFEW